jgi:hypothetical protein
MKQTLFVQLPPPRFSFEIPPTNIPLAAGFLLAALGQDPELTLKVDVLPPESVDVLGDKALCSDILRRDPGIIAFSLYVWNVERSLFLASMIKRRSPGTVMLVGGPEVTPDNRWVLDHPAVDLAVFGEGESRITTLLGSAEIRAFARIPGIAWKDPKNRLQINTDSPEPWQLDTCEYPYLDGKIKPSQDGTLFLETMRGCPFRCRYCYYHKAFCSLRFHSNDRLDKVLDFAYSPESKIREVYLMDPTFNARKGFRRLLRSMARRRRRSEYPKLHTELRADFLEPTDLPVLQKAGLASAEIGLQSTNLEALRAAGRKGDPEKIATGVGLLKQIGVEVTTGIIVGLPRDTPRDFSRTLQWLNKKEAYSVVHPFVLSILPGTDFRANAEQLGLVYDPKPPYHIRSTPTFKTEKIQSALLECEQAFNMEMDYIAPPSLVDRGPEVVQSVEEGYYISKWIVNPATEAWRKDLRQIIEKAADPFTLWFRGEYHKEHMIEILSEFTNTNPHAVVHVVLELQEPPPMDFFEAALASAGNPDLFLNRSYFPLCGEGEVVNINFCIIVPDPGNTAGKRTISRRYSSFATVIWDSAEYRRDLVTRLETPMLISWELESYDVTFKRGLNRLLKFHGTNHEEVLFRNPSHVRIWKRLASGWNTDWQFRESILKSTYTDVLSKQ